jgi:hypothetical protein
MIVLLRCTHQRPLYKRKPRRLTMAQWRAARARGCDELVRRLERLRDATRGLALRSHPTTYQLTDEPSPMDDHHYKHREDLIDACLAAWTAALWVTAGPDRVQILGADDALVDERGFRATILAPARPEQRMPITAPGDLGSAATLEGPGF